MSLDRLPGVRDVPSVTAEQMAAVDRIAIEDIGVSVDALMENAAHQVARVARELLGQVAGRQVVAFVGAGNNGGDAAGALRHLLAWGATVRAEVVAPVEQVRERTRRQLVALLGAGPAVVRALDPASARATLPRGDLAIDGLIGYSGRGAARGAVAELIAEANAQGAPILAVDLPSGLDPNSGAAPGATIRAAVTVTLALPKAGLLARAAGEWVGELVLADIGIPHAAFARIGVDTTRLFQDGDLVRILR